MVLRIRVVSLRIALGLAFFALSASSSACVTVFSAVRVRADEQIVARGTCFASAVAAALLAGRRGVCRGARSSSSDSELVHAALALLPG